MKRVYLILTLFIASFFFVSLNKVSAATYEFTLSENSFDMLNDDFFEFRDKVLKYVQENNIEIYLIYYNSNFKQYRALLSNDNYRIFIKPETISGQRWLRYTQVNFNNFYYDSLGNLVFKSINSGQNNLLNSSTNLDYYLDSNFDLTGYDTYYGVDYIESEFYYIHYKDLTYTLTEGVAIPTLYQIYQDYNKQEEGPAVDDKFTNEKELMNNFYLTIFTKISDLATSLANNYIFLTIFGIFILIFVLELIRRYLL